MLRRGWGRDSRFRRLVSIFTEAGDARQRRAPAPVDHCIPKVLTADPAGPFRAAEHSLMMLVQDEF